MDDGYNPIKSEIESLKKKVETLEQKLKEKDLPIQDEVRYKQNERARVEMVEQQLKEKDKEIEAITKQLKLSFNAFNQINIALNIRLDIISTSSTASGNRVSINIFCSTTGTKIRTGDISNV